MLQSQIDLLVGELNIGCVRPVWRLVGCGGRIA